MRRASLLAILTVSLLSLAACGRDDAPKVKTSTDSSGTQTVTVTDGKGTQVTVTGPGGSANMPAFAPLFPGAIVGSTVTTPDKGGMVVFKTSAAPQDVIDFYKKSAAGAGMKDNLSMTSGDTISYSASSQSPAHSLSITAAKGDGGTQVQVIWN